MTAPVQPHEGAAPHEPVSYRWITVSRAPVNRDWVFTDKSAAFQACWILCRDTLHVRLANGSLVIVKPKER